MSNERTIQALRELADRMESSADTVEYIGEDGLYHTAYVGVRVDHLPRSVEIPPLLV